MNQPTVVKSVACESCGTTLRKRVCAECDDQRATRIARVLAMLNPIADRADELGKEMMFHGDTWESLHDHPRSADDVELFHLACDPATIREMRDILKGDCLACVDGDCGVDHEALTPTESEK